MLTRFLSLMLAVILLALSLTACGDKKDNNKTTDPSDEQTNNEYAEPYFDEVVMKIGDIEITYETYRYLYMSCRSTYEESKTPKTVDEIKAEVLSELFYQSAIRTLANRYDQNLTDKQTKELLIQVETLEKTYAEYGSSLEDMLASRYMTKKVYKDFYALETYLTTGVYEYCKNKDNSVLDFSKQAVDDMMSQYSRALMIFVAINDERNEENAKKKAEGILEKLAEGADFTETAKQYSDDMGSDAEIGFYFKEEGTDENIVAAYNAINEGEYTKEPIKTPNGYYILYRLAVDTEHFEKELYPYYAFNEFLQATKESLSVTYTDFFNGMFNGKDLVYEKKTAK